MIGEGNREEIAVNANEERLKEIQQKEEEIKVQKVKIEKENKTEKEEGEEKKKGNKVNKVEEGEERREGGKKGGKREEEETEEELVENLTWYDMHRKPIELKEEELEINASHLKTLLTCPICLDITNDVYTTMDCVHRFCSECISSSLRWGFLFIWEKKKINLYYKH